MFWIILLLSLVFKNFDSSLFLLFFLSFFFLDLIILFMELWMKLIEFLSFFLEFMFSVFLYFYMLMMGVMLCIVENLEVLLNVFMSGGMGWESFK